MVRAIDAKIDALYVDGTDTGVVVNAFVKKTLGVDLAKSRLVRVREEGGGDAWALREFEKYVGETRTKDARVGVIVDRDGIEGRRDNWPAVRDLLARLGGTCNAPVPEGHIIQGRIGVWLWPDNALPGDLETFLAGIIPGSPILTWATEASRLAKDLHGAEYDPHHARKAGLKVRSIWRDASAAGGYGHLVRNLPLTETTASAHFRSWFQTLFLAA